jgi:hypothetical protein
MVARLNVSNLRVGSVLEVETGVDGLKVVEYKCYQQTRLNI